MKIDYLKFVQWSEADRLFIGYCPDLFIGGVCHGADEQKVYRQLSRLVAQEIAETEKACRALPKKQALVTVPVAVAIAAEALAQRLERFDRKDIDLSIAPLD